MKADYNDLILERWFRARISGELKWHTKNGDCIPIKEMTDEHLNNAIAYLESKEDDLLSFTGVNDAD